MGKFFSYSFIIAFWHTKGRLPTSLLTIVALAFSIAIMIFMTGIQWGFYGTLERSYTQLFVGQYQILKSDFDLNNLEASHFNEGWIDTARLSQLAEHGYSFSKRLYADALLLGDKGKGDYVLRLVGVNGSDENKVAGYFRSVKTDSSENPRNLLSTNEILVGKALADRLGLRQGQSHSFLLARKDGSISVEDFIVKGWLVSGQEELESNLAYVDLRHLQSISGQEDQLHSVTLYARSDEEAGKAIEGMWMPPQLKIVNWEYFRPDLKQFIDFDISLGWFYYVVMILIIGVSIYNFYNIQIYHRYREVTVFLALGLLKRKIFLIVAAEIFWVFLMGIAWGTMIGVGVLWIYRDGFLIPGTNAVAQHLGVSPYVIPKIFSPAHLIIPVSIFFFFALAMAHFSVKLYRNDKVKP